MALSVPLRDPAIHRYIALCCPDFPSPSKETIARLVVAAKIPFFNVLINAPLVKICQANIERISLWLHNQNERHTDLQRT